MTPLKITLVDNRPALLITEELLTRLQASVGDELHAIQTLNGFEVVASPETARQLEAARRVMSEDHQALSKLAE